MKFIRSRVPLWAGAKISAFKMRFQLTFLPVILVQNFHLKWKLETRNYPVQVFLCKNEKPLAQVDTSLGSPHCPLESWDSKPSQLTWSTPLVSSHHTTPPSIQWDPEIVPRYLDSVMWLAPTTQFFQHAGAVCFYCKNCLLDALHFGSRGIKQTLQASKQDSTFINRQMGKIFRTIQFCSSRLFKWQVAIRLAQV